LISAITFRKCKHGEPILIPINLCFNFYFFLKTCDLKFFSKSIILILLKEYNVHSKQVGSIETSKMKKNQGSKHSNPSKHTYRGHSSQILGNGRLYYRPTVTDERPKSIFTGFIETTRCRYALAFVNI
jgi:hypothetical protein